MANTVDFNNPDELEKELAAANEAAETEADASAKTRKPKGPKVIKVTFTADHDIKAGETITFDYEVPVSARRVGVNTGIAIEDMNEAQLKIEYRNANSVLYKTKKAGRDATKAQERVDAVLAAMEAKGIKPGTRVATATQPLDAAGIANLIKSGKVSVEDIQKLLDSEG